MQKKIITFYSYKGGVGRTMALANAACQLANKHGLNVIAVDWDLEAPGLHYYFDFTDQELDKKPGLIDYLYDFVDEVKKGKQGKVPDINNYLTKPKLQTSKKIKNGSVTLLTCGMTNQSYMSRVQNFNWAKFYEECEGYQIIETLKKQLLKASDVALIDSRAGQADISSTSTIQMPDAILFFFTSNRQSIEGTANLAKKLKDHPFRINQGFEDIRMLMIPSRVFSEDDRFDYWLKSVANPVFDGLVKTGIIAKEDQPKGLQQCVLGVEPRFTFKEELPVLDESYTQSSLKSSYEQLTYAITDLLEGRRLWSSQRKLPFQLSLNETNTSVISYSRTIELDCDAEIEAEKLKNEISSASERGDDHRSAYLSYKLGQVLLVLSKVEEAELLLKASLTYNKSRGSLDAISAVEYSLGNIKMYSKKYNEAIRHFEESLKIDKVLKNISGESSAYYQIGLAQNNITSYDDAIKSFKNALKLAKKIEDKDLEGRTNNAIALSYYSISNYSQAMKFLTDYLKISEENNDKYNSSIAHFALGIVSKAQKNYTKALTYIDKTIPFNRKIRNYTTLLACYRLCGDIYVEIADTNNAISSYKQALKTAKAHCDKSDVISILMTLSTFYNSINNIKLAKETISEALIIANALKDKPLIKKVRDLQVKYDKILG